MGRLAGFRYNKVIKKLKLLGFTFYRHAAGSHEICSTLIPGATQPSQTILAICQKARCVPFLNRRTSNRMIF
jgi:predicted RNA binding protein YcfA (HicA-like mRNA interferase family)